jgi:hypothetical protein
MLDHKRLVDVFVVDILSPVIVLLRLLAEEAMIAEVIMIWDDDVELGGVSKPTRYRRRLGHDDAKELVALGNSHTMARATRLM